MSRTLVRAVLAKLQSEGAGRRRTKRTAIVAQPTLAEARDVFEVRRALEAQAVDAWSSSAGSLAFGAELEGLVREEDAARERHEEHVAEASRRRVSLSGSAKLSGNVLLGTIHVRAGDALLADPRRVRGSPHTHDHGGPNEHTEIIAALRAGDAAKALAHHGRALAAVERRAVA